MKNVLLAVLGRSPQIITETLYFLTQVKKERIDGIQVITTRAGYQEFVENLTANGKGYFYQFCEAYGLNAIDFGLKKPTLLKDSRGNALMDIRTNEENGLAANQIIEAIRNLTADKDTRLFCSMAGGRKTMGVYASFAMQFYGREFDRLYHVLVWPPELEGAKDFYFPSPKKGEFTYHRGSDEIKVSADEIRIDLAEIPFIRLRGIIGEKINLNLPFAQLVHLAQAVINEHQWPKMILIPQEKQVTLQFANRKETIIKLKPREIAVLAYLMELDKPLFVNDFDTERISEIYEKYFAQREYGFGKVSDHLRKIKNEIIRELISRIRSAMRKELKTYYGIEKYADQYLPQTISRKDPRYFIPIPMDRRSVKE